MTNSRWQKAALAAVVSAVIISMAGCGKAPVAEAPVRAVKTVVLSETGGSLDREFAADIHARKESRLGFRVGGKVSARDVELGQAVKEGQVLARLDPQDLQLGQEAARAGVVAAEANATQAAADLKRFTELKAQGFISAAELERHAAMTKAAESSLKQARAQAGVQGNQTAYAALTAPASGVITAVDVEPGQVVAPGQPVFVLALNGPRDAVFAVPESQARSTRALVGKKNAVEVRAWGTDRWVRATIREMAAAADPVSRTFLVKADVGSDGFELGQTASVKVLAALNNREGVRVPLHAVAERGGKSVVWTLDPQSYTVQPQVVTTGDILGDVVLVTKGLKPGQEIVVAGAHVLNPGQKVRRYQQPTQAGNKS